MSQETGPSLNPASRTPLEEGHAYLARRDSSFISRFVLPVLEVLTAGIFSRAEEDHAAHRLKEIVLRRPTQGPSSQ